MKKFFVFFTACVMMLSLVLSGCGSADADRQEELNDSLEKTYEELTATFSGETGEYELVAEYLQSWASKNDITIAANENSYIVLKNPATEGSKDADNTTLQCMIDTSAFSKSLQSLSISLTALLGPLEHGDITLLITETTDGEYKGAAAVDEKYLKSDSFINIEQNDDIELHTSGSYACTASMTTDIPESEPYYGNAYTITMKISGYHDPFNNDTADYPNPVEVIGNLLASEKSSGQLFQLASFNCEAKTGYVPTSATAVVVIDDNDISSFEKKFKSSYNNMKKKFEELEDNFVYTFTAADMPDSVISNETSDNIISLMYTLKTGKYHPSEEDTEDTIEDESEDKAKEDKEICALAEISSVSTKGGKFRLTTSFRGTDEDIISELSDVYLTISGLCDISYKKSENHITWPTKDNSDLATYFTEALGAEETVFDCDLETSECDILASKTGLEMISYQCNIHHGEAALANLCGFMNTSAE